MSGFTVLSITGHLCSGGSCDWTDADHQIFMISCQLQNLLRRFSLHTFQTRLTFLTHFPSCSPLMDAAIGVCVNNSRLDRAGVCQVISAPCGGKASPDALQNGFCHVSDEKPISKCFSRASGWRACVWIDWRGEIECVNESTSAAALKVERSFSVCLFWLCLFL